MIRGALKGSAGLPAAQILLMLFAVCLFAWVFWTGYRIGLQIERAALIAGIWTHVGHGLVTAPLFVGYLWHRIASRNASSHHRVSKFALWLLCVCTVFLIVSGPVVVWTYGSDLKVFDWFVVANPIGKLPIVHDPLEGAHKVVALALPAIIGLDLILIFARRGRRRGANA